MNIEEVIYIIDKELHKKWDKTIEKKNGKTFIHLGDEEPLNEFEIASQRCLIEVQMLNRRIEEKDKEIERLNSIIKEVREYIKETHYYSEVINEEYLLKSELLEILDKVGSDKD